MSPIKIYFLFIIFIYTQQTVCSQSNITTVPDFTLLNVINNTQVSLSNYTNKLAIVIVFSSNTCPYSKLYEQRILNLYASYSEKNVAFLLINSNNSSLSDVDNIMRMKIKASKIALPFPYLADKENLAMKIFKAEKTPEVFVLAKNIKNDLIVFYNGAIDDSPQSEEFVKNKYIELALNNILVGKPAPIQYKRPVGCRIISN